MDSRVFAAIQWAQGEFFGFFFADSANSWRVRSQFYGLTVVITIDGAIHFRPLKTACRKWLAKLPEPSWARRSSDE
jgi:hypothetical protein